MFVVVIVAAAAVAGSRLCAIVSGWRRSGGALLGRRDERCVSFLGAAMTHVVLVLRDAVDADAMEMEPQLADVTLHPRHLVT